MQIIEKFKAKHETMYDHRRPVIAFLGDSVTQGCFEIFDDHGHIETKFCPEDAYSEKVGHILGMLYPNAAPVIVNAGISGDTSWNGLTRLERDVLSFRPELVTVCYGLNDAGWGEGKIDEYEKSMRGIFEGIKASGAEAIFLTPSLRSDDTDYRNPVKMLEDCVRQNAKNEREC